MVTDAMCELARMGVDGIHFDYIRYPDSGHCFCSGCRARFEAFAGAARISLALASPESFKVYELETSGRRLGTLPAEVRGGRLEFTASVPGPHGARILYEIAQRLNGP